MTQQDKRIEWKSRYDAWKKSGLSAAAWCRKHNLKEHQMYYWIQKLEDKNVPSLKEEIPATSWMPIKVDHSIADGVDEGAVFIHFDSLSIEVRPGASMSVVSNVMTLLRKPC